MTVPLRPYQTQAVEATVAALAGARSALIVAPTGTGKTQIFVAVAERLRPSGPVLILAHREELIAQAQARIEEYTTLTVAVEMAAARAAGLASDVVLASVQSLSRPSRLAKFAPDAFGLVVVDEAHHVPARTYRRILDHFPSAKVLGCTATPDRLDGAGLRQVFETVAFQYELRAAIADGWLAPIQQVRVEVDGLDLSRVRTVAGDFNEGDLERAVTADGVLHEVAAPIAKHAGARPTLIFGVTVAHARALAEVLGFYVGGARVAALAGDDDREHRRQTLQAFLAGSLQFLVNCALFTEGVDLPPTACVAMARPTKSRALYAQMIGRGTRLAPGKENLLVLDFAGNAGRHRLVSALDVLAGAAVDPEVERRAQEIMNALDGVDVVTALADAEAAVAAERRRVAQVDVRARLVEVDPFTGRRAAVDAFWLLGVPRPPRQPGTPPMTDPQREALARTGIPTAELDRRQASALLSALAVRRTTGRCTFKQARFLAHHGFGPHASFEEAGRTITEIIARGRRRAVRA